LYRCPFAVDVVSGGGLRLKFEIPYELARQGVILHGAYWENDEITLAISSLKGSVPVSKTETLLVGRIYETARYRQIRAEFPSTKKRAKKGKK
jgi:hypothetical protein